ncbi:MAG: hypothetical protein OXC63_11475 [Aestuariivita sp.]|nr:hypothetical protein [Aestuariivita sp.]MCY4346116.1 hypothetical protein [Aestuariivita sp.]
MEYSIVHISDLDFKNDVRIVKNVVEARFCLEKMLEDLRSRFLGSNIVATFTGDLAQSGERELYETLFELHN